MNNRTEIIDWVIDNKELILEKSQEYISQYELLLEFEPIQLHTELKKEFKEAINNTIYKELQYSLSVSLEDVIIILEEVDILNIWGVL